MSIVSDKTLIINAIKSHYGFTKDREFANFLGIKPTTLSSWYARNSFDYELVYAKCKDIDGNWLLTGEGNMLKITNPVIIKNEFTVKTDKIRESQIVKLYNMEAVAGFMPIFENKMEVVDYLDVPNIPKCDGGIFIRGDSMKPIMERGDIALYKFVNNQDEWMYGKIHIISYEQSDGFIKTVIKYLNRAENKEVVRLTSNNEDYNYNDIKTNRIKAIAQVMAIVRVNVFF